MFQRLSVLLSPSADWGPTKAMVEMKRVLLTLPDYMVSEREEGAVIPALSLKRKYSLYSEDGTGVRGIIM